MFGYFKSLRRIYQTYQKGKSRCAVCFEPRLKGKGLIDVIMLSPFLCRSCQFYPRQRVLKRDDYVATVFYDYEGSFRNALLQYKEYQDRFLAPCFLYPIFLDLLLRFGNHTFVVAPSRLESQKKRGFHHLELMLEVYGFKTCSPFENVALHDQTQASNRQAIHEAIFLKEGVTIPTKRVVLFDDVISSGATMARCYQLLKTTCRKVQVVVLSSTEK